MLAELLHKQGNGPAHHDTQAQRRREAGGGGREVKLTKKLHRPIVPPSHCSLGGVSP